MDGFVSSGRRATLAMVAETAGVTTPTVSKVLNGRPDISPATRSRVQRALREHEYVGPAGRRARQHSRTVELVFGDYRNPYFGEMLQGVTHEASDRGIQIVLDRPVDSGRAWARRLIRGNRAGSVVVTTELSQDHLDAFEEAGRHLVVIDPVNMPKVDVSSIGATNFAGGMTATQHLMSLGHKRIAFVGGPTHTACSQARFHGYRAALEGGGVAFDPNLELRGAFDYHHGYGAGAILLDRSLPPTAIFAGCDPIAFGVMEAARKRGISVPHRLSVVGFDNTYVAAWTCPPLTTVHQPLQEMGRAAVRTLETLVAGSTPEAHHIELATHLVIRSSTSAPT